DIFTFYVPHRHVYGEQWIKFMKDGVNATPLPTVNTTGYIDHAAFLGTINPDTNKIPKHLLDRKSGSAGMPRPISYAVFCLKKKTARSEAFGLPEGYKPRGSRQDAAPRPRLHRYASIPVRYSDRPAPRVMYWLR